MLSETKYGPAPTIAELRQQGKTSPAPKAPARKRPVRKAPTRRR